MQGLSARLVGEDQLDGICFSHRDAHFGRAQGRPLADAARQLESPSKLQLSRRQRDQRVEVEALDVLRHAEELDVVDQRPALREASQDRAGAVGGRTEHLAVSSVGLEDGQHRTQQRLLFLDEEDRVLCELHLLGFHQEAEQVVAAQRHDAARHAPGLPSREGVRHGDDGSQE